MQRKLLVAIFAFLLLVIIAFLANLLSVGSVDSISNTPVIKSAIKMAKQVANSENWSSKMANIKKTEYFFPVNELYVQIDLQKEVKKILNPAQKSDKNKGKQEAYRLVIDRNDRYSLYCIRQTLSSFPYSYSIVKDKDKIYIVVDVAKSEVLAKIVEKLKEYEIQSTIKKVWL